MLVGFRQDGWVYRLDQLIPLHGLTDRCFGRNDYGSSYYGGFRSVYQRSYEGVIGATIG